MEAQFSILLLGPAELGIWSTTAGRWAQDEATIDVWAGMLYIRGSCAEMIRARREARGERVRVLCVALYQKEDC